MFPKLPKRLYLPFSMYDIIRCNVMSKEEKEEGSFVAEAVTEPPKQPTPPTSANAPLFKLMGEIRDAIKKQTEVIKENTEAMNSLLTTIVGQTRETVLVPKPETNLYKKSNDLTLENTPLPSPSETPSVSTQIEQVKMLFPEDLEQLLTFTDEGDHIKVKPRQFLGSDSFAKVAAIIRAANGEYKSAGKESHFRISK